MVSLSQRLDNRKNNFDFIRFLAASLVIFSHSFPLTWGNDEKDPLYIFSNGQITVGHLSVVTFFVISGFLITMSYDRNPNIISFVKSRFLRIFPGLALMLLLTVFVLGPLLTTVPLHEYFTNPMTFDYLKNIYLHKPPFVLTGMFPNNPYKSVVNGSLWTLEYEAFCYLIVAVLGVLRLLRKEIVLLFLLFVMFGPFFMSFGTYYFTSSLSVEMVSYFMSGSVAYCFRKYIPMNKYLAIISAAVLVGSFAYGHFKMIFPFFGTYLVMYTSFLPTERLWNFAKHGDFSYGIYIYAFPIQQTVAMFLGKGINPAKLFLFSLPITLIFSVMSWYVIEKHALKLKQVHFLPKLHRSKTRTAS